MLKQPMQHGDLRVIHSDCTGLIADDQRLMVEIACGATVSLVYENLLKEAVPNLTEQSTVVLVVCGGRPAFDGTDTQDRALRLNHLWN
jgi:hypothetical protein